MRKIDGDKALGIAQITVGILGITAGIIKLVKSTEPSKYYTVIHR